MPEIDFKKIVAESIAFTKAEVGAAWNKLKPYAEHEATQFAENAAFLARLKLKGVIDDDELQARINMQRLAMINVLLAIKGVGLVTAQNVVNGVLQIISKALKKAINIALPI